MNDTPNHSSLGASNAPQPTLVVGNLADPIRLKQVELNGVAAEAARGGEMVKVWTRLALTSDDPLFHRIVEGLSRVIAHRAALAGAPLDIERVKTLLLVIKPDQSAELWADTAAVSVNVMLKQSAATGQVIFEDDIVDVIGMGFPAIVIEKNDKVVCIFRQDWRFGLFFDFNTSNDFNHSNFQRTLGSLYRSLKYRHIYDALGQADVFERLVAAGWFPFAEILTSEFKELLQHCEAGFEINEIEERILPRFDEQRLVRMLDRWLAKPHFVSREAILRSAIQSYLASNSVAVIKTVLTEIEGVLNSAHRATHGQGAKIPKLLEFAVTSAEQKAGEPHTLLLPQAFADYLTRRTFAHFDPVKGVGEAASRHAVGHGEAPASGYTQIAALQALLTLDQLAFCT
ncbi:MAG: hypothetical protein AB7F89_17505 [Pirellulaceae bacterium]